MRLRYKTPLTKLPKNGWHCVFDGYDFKRNSCGELVEAINKYIIENNLEGDAYNIVEDAFCAENPNQCELKSE